MISYECPPQNDIADDLANSNEASSSVPSRVSPVMDPGFDPRRFDATKDSEPPTVGQVSKQLLISR